MKKLTVHLFSSMFLILFSFRLFADIIPPDHHSVPRCIKIENLQEFSEVKIVGLITGPVVRGYEAYEAQPNECLHKGYKFNNLDLYSVDSNYFKGIDLAKLVIESERIQDSQFKFLTDKLDPAEQYVPNSDQTRSETLIYHLKKNSVGKYKLKLVKHSRQ